MSCLKKNLISFCCQCLYVLPNDILKQNENKKVTLSFLSLQHPISVTKEKFSRDSRIEECMLFYLATVLSYSYYQERPDFDDLFVRSFVFFCYQ